MATGSRVPAQSILRQPTQTPTATPPDEERQKAERDRRNLGIALYHANRIQDQKNAQTKILSSIETLLDIPAAPVFTQQEATTFLSLVQLFQPSDFDALVDERRVDGKCGYALCANVPRSAGMGASAAWKLKSKGAGDYCSDACVEKALYVKAQLSEVPAWERESEHQPAIFLHEDDRLGAEPKASPNKHLEDGRTSDAQELALERGESKATATFRPKQVMADFVVEKHSTGTKQGRFHPGAIASHTAIEGHEPGAISTKRYIRSQIEDGDQDVYESHDYEEHSDDSEND